MSIQQAIRGITIDQSLLHGIVGHYVLQMESAGHARAAVLRRWMEEGAQQQQRGCLEAASQALICSQLSASLVDDAEFATALSGCSRLGDPDLCALRADLFDQALAVALEAIGVDAVSRATGRAQAVREAFLAAG